MYAVLPSKWDGSIFDTTPHAGMPVMFLLTSFHFAPPSRAYHTLPSCVPAPTTTVYSWVKAIANTTSGANCPRLSPTIPPDDMILLASCVDRSPLVGAQLWPPLVVLKITLQP